MTAADFSRLTDVEWRRSHESHNGLFVAEGAKVIGRAFELGYKPREILTTQKWIDTLPAELLDQAKLHLVSDAEIESITGFNVHRGALASFHRPDSKTLHEVVRTAKSVAILEGLVDHENVGAIFRSAAGLGIDAIVITEDCADPLYRRSIKTSMGATLVMPYARVSSVRAAISEMSEFTFFGLALQAEEELMTATFDDSPSAFVFGSEGHGMSSEASALIDRLVRIPMSNNLDSLNVAQCASIVFWAYAQRVNG